VTWVGVPSRESREKRNTGGISFRATRRKRQKSDSIGRKKKASEAVSSQKRPEAQEGDAIARRKQRGPKIAYPLDIFKKKRLGKIKGSHGGKLSAPVEKHLGKKLNVGDRQNREKL